MKSRIRPLVAVPLVIVIFILFLSDTLGTAKSFKPWNGYASYNVESFKAHAPANKQIDFNNIDYGLLQAAVFYETNQMRQIRGKSPLLHSDGLERSAMMHAMDMAERDFFSHDNPYDAKKARFTDRTAMFSAKGAAENIATTFGIQYKAGTSVSSISSIPPHTYNSFAVALVDGWMNSSGHKANILDERNSGYKYLGCGVYPIPGDSWKKFYAVQNFGYSVSDDAPATATSGNTQSGTAPADSSSGGAASASNTAPSAAGAIGSGSSGAQAGAAPKSSSASETFYITQVEYFTGQNGSWKQVGASGKTTYTFSETERDGEYIYIFDKSRGVSIALPVNGGPSYIKEPGMKNWTKWLSVRK